MIPAGVRSNSACNARAISALRAALALIAREHPAAREVRLTVHPDNAAARRLYEREGFRVTGEQRDGEDVFVWGLSRQ